MDSAGVDFGDERYRVALMMPIIRGGVRLVFFFCFMFRDSIC